MSDEPNIMLVPPGMARQFVPTVEGLLAGKKFPGPFFYTLEHLFQKLEQGTMQLWLAFEEGESPFMMLVTEICEFPAGKVLQYNLLAGSDVRKILPHMWKVEGWAQMNGAFMATLSTRPKLAAILRRYGYRAPLTTVYKPLITVQ